MEFEITREATAADANGVIISTLQAATAAIRGSLVKDGCTVTAIYVFPRGRCIDNPTDEELIEEARPILEKAVGL